MLNGTEGASIVCHSLKAALFAFLLLLFLLLSSAVAAASDVALGSDTVAYINNNPLPTVSINGRAAVYASDLEGYGFTCVYNDYLRRVDVKFDGGKIKPLHFWRDKASVGVPTAEILPTDIETRLDGEFVESFNLDGRTAIYFSSLSKYGDIRSDEELRAVFLNIESMETAEFQVVEDRSTAMASLNFSCQVGGSMCEFNLIVPVSLYDAFASEPRLSGGLDSYAAYACDPRDDIYISALADCLVRLCESSGLSALETAQTAASFVQAFTYIDDIDAKNVSEYPNYPIETLFEQKGDCEDMAVLLACLLEEMGFDAALLALESDGGGHMAVGLKNGGALDLIGTCYPYGGELYFYIEATGSGWTIGNVPLEHQGKKAHVITLKN